MSEAPQRLLPLRWILPIAVLLALLAISCKSGGGGPDGPPITVPPGATGSQHALGSPQAPIELTEYADFQ